jgi:hypothetical protein
LRSPRPHAVLALPLSIVLLAGAAAGAGASDISRTMRTPRGFGGGGSEPYTVDRRHTFYEGGVALPSSATALFAGGWTVSAGLELPVTAKWSMLPRLHVTGARVEPSGSLDLLRLGLDGRWSSRSGGLIRYQEAGLGMGLADVPVTVAGPNASTHSEQRSSGFPFLQLVGGLRGDPDLAPAFQVEIILGAGLGVERPTTLEALIGIAF